VGKRAKYVSLMSMMLGVLLLFTGPVSVGAAPPASHITVKLVTEPIKPVAGGETRVTINLTDTRQKSPVSVPVAVSADKVSATAAVGHAGMLHGGSNQPAPPALTTMAKATGKPGEYIATLKIPEVGPWRIMATAGDTQAHVDVDVVKAPASSGSSEIVLKNVLPAPRVQNGSVKPAAMEAIHASYLDLAANISDLRTRVGEWQKGEEGSLNIAKEKMERMEVIVASVTWPKEMAVSVRKIVAAYGPMAKALMSKDMAAAEVAAKAMGDASHDFTHEFYPDFLPALQGTGFSMMAPHAIYLDLNANINDLGSRITAWQKGDESSLNIAKEKVERIGILLPHMASTGVTLKSLQAIEKTLPPMSDALETKDIPAAQQALKQITDASRPLTNDIYSWMNLTAEATSSACVQASYLDLAANVSQLRTQVGEWQKGNPSSLNIAEDRLQKIELLLAHTAWPQGMAPAINTIEGAVAFTTKALKANDVSSVDAVLKGLGDGSHDVTHAYYGDWLPYAELDKTADVIGGVRSQGVVSAGAHDEGGHGAGAEGEVPNYWFVGSIVGMVVLTTGMVPFLRRRDLATRRVEIK